MLEDTFPGEALSIRHIGTGVLLLASRTYCMVSTSVLGSIFPLRADFQSIIITSNKRLVPYRICFASQLPLPSFRFSGSTALVIDNYQGPCSSARA